MRDVRSIAANVVVAGLVAAVALEMICVSDR